MLYPSIDDYEDYDDHDYYYDNDYPSYDAVYDVMKRAYAARQPEAAGRDVSDARFVDVHKYLKSHKRAPPPALRAPPAALLAPALKSVPPQQQSLVDYLNFGPLYDDDTATGDYYEDYNSDFEPTGTSTLVVHWDGASTPVVHS